MRIFLAGASGVIGRRLTPMLVQAGHEVAGTTRSAEKAGLLQDLGAAPVVVDVYDAEALRIAVVDFAPAIVMHQVTDLPDDAAEIPARAAGNARMREVGTANLIAAAAAADADRFLAQSIAWTPAAGNESRESLESQTLAYGGVGVVLRYGQLYGPGTYYESEPPEAPRIEISAAACQTVSALDAPTGTVEILD